MDNSGPPPTSQQSSEEVKPEIVTPSGENPYVTQKKPKSKRLVALLRFLIIGGGLFIVFVIGLGISFSACFTIKGPPPPECGPVSFVSLILMPGASLLFLIPLARRIK